MRQDGEQSVEGGFDEATTGFIDIQFGLIAILILALSATTAGFLSTLSRLELTEAGAEVFVRLLLYEPGTKDEKKQRANCGSGRGEHLPTNSFGDLGLVLCAEWSDGVAVLGPGEGATGELFGNNANRLPTTDHGGQDIVERLRTRTYRFFPCFAPLDRAMRFDEEGRRKFKQVIEDCESIYLKEASRHLAVLEGNGATTSGLPGLDLFIIEGHADGGPPHSAEAAAVAEARAQRILYALLANEDNARNSFVEYVNRRDGAALPLEIDRISLELPGAEGRGGYRSALLDLVPLSTRILQECLEEHQRIGRNAGGARTLWCERILSAVGAEGATDSDSAEGVTDSDAGGVSRPGPKERRLRVPRMFAVSSYGRFSLRYGELGVPNSRDRRVEFRFRPAAIPSAIHELVRDRNDLSYYRLYQAEAALVLHRCDLERESDRTCVRALDALVKGGTHAGYR